MDFKIEKLPKVELHVHLDCCLSYEALVKLDPSVSLSTFKKKFIGTSCSCLKDYIKCADNALEYMSTNSDLLLLNPLVFALAILLDITPKSFWIASNPFLVIVNIMTPNIKHVAKLIPFIYFIIVTK